MSDVRFPIPNTFMFLVSLFTGAYLIFTSIFCFKTKVFGSFPMYDDQWRRWRYQRKNVSISFHIYGTNLCVWWAESVIINENYNRMWKHTQKSEERNKCKEYDFSTFQRLKWNMFETHEKCVVRMKGKNHSNVSIMHIFIFILIFFSFSCIFSSVCVRWKRMLCFAQKKNFVHVFFK